MIRHVADLAIDGPLGSPGAVVLSADCPCHTGVTIGVAVDRLEGVPVVAIIILGELAPAEDSN